MSKKNTMVELVQELEAINKNGAYDEMIKEAKAGEYHDFKNNKYPCGKQALFGKLCDVHLYDMARSVMNGDYDEEPDADDKRRVAADIRSNGGSEALLEMMGLKDY